jgi:hypothetical protein
MEGCSCFELLCPLEVHNQPSGFTSVITNMYLHASLSPLLLLLIQILQIAPGTETTESFVIFASMVSDLFSKLNKPF